MNKRQVNFIIFMLVVSTVQGYAVPPALKNFLSKQDASGVDDAVLLKAERLMAYFSGEDADVDRDLTVSIRRIRNPFISGIPEPEPVPEIKMDTRRSDPIPETMVIDDHVEPAPQVVISGLVWDTARPQAIIDNLIMNVGDSIGSWMIVEISQKGILVESASRARYLLKP